MIASFSEKIKESVVSIAPVMLIVVLLYFSIATFTDGQLPQFIVSGLLLMLSLSIFLVGADTGMLSFGQLGFALTHKHNLPLLLEVSFIIGLAITIAAPDVQVPAAQVSTVVPSLNKQILVMVIAFGSFGGVVYAINVEQFIVLGK